MRRWWVVVLVLGIDAACGSTETTVSHCTPGQTIACVGAGPCSGVQTCRSDGTYDPCMCGDSGTPIDAAMSDAGFDAGMDAMDATIDSAPDVIEASVDAPKDVEPDVLLDASDSGPLSKAWTRATFGATLWRVAASPSNDLLAVGWTKQNAPLMVKWDPNGNSLPWKANLSGDAFAFAVAIDAQGNAYVAGLVNATSDLGGGSFSAGGFIAKYDAQGNQIWQRGPYGAEFRGIAVKSNGNVVIGGELASATNFGGGVLTPNGHDAVLVELTSAGQYVRAKAFGPNVSSTEIVRALALDANDNLFLTGSFTDSINFGGNTLNGPSWYIAKLDGNFAHVASVDLKSTGNDSIESLATDSNGNVYAVGYVSGSFDFGGGTISPQGGPDVVFAKLGSSLGHAFSKRFGDGAGQFGNAVTVANGKVAIVGGYDGVTDFGKGSLGNPNGAGLFLATFDTSGNALTSYGTGPNSICGALSVVPLGPDYALTGEYQQSCTLPSGTIFANNSPDTFVARMPP